MMETMNAEEIAQEAVQAIKNKIKNLHTLNIIVAGRTGVGKSTLINAVFREHIANTGIGKPVTEHMKGLRKEGIPLTIYDTRGFELGKEAQDEVKQEVMETIKKGVASKDINQAIHCIWYCINTAANRIEPEEIAWLKELSQENQSTRVPIIVILTQSFSKKKAEEMKKVLMEENLDVVQIIPVLAEDYEIEDLGIAKSYGLDILVQVMSEVLPDELIDTLQNVQIASLKEKKRRAQEAVATAALAAAGEGAVPIPLSDCIVLVPTQIGMIVSITVLFGLDVNKSIIMTVLSSTIGAGGATILGKTVVTNLLKVFPGVGSIVGGVISGTTAAVITTALGEAYIAIMEMVYKGDMDIDDFQTRKGQEIISHLFKEKLTSYA